MASGGGGAGPPRGRRVSFLFRRSQGAGHCTGVNALALAPDEQHLWTASRDSTIACWDTGGRPQPALLHEHVGHIDWVNGVALAGDVLASCSNDQTLRVWQPYSPDAALGCLRGHTDYVTCLAAAPGGAWLASGGLRGEVLLWDLAALRAVIAGGVPGQSYGASAAEVPRHSVYALAMSGDASLVAAGSTQGLVSVVDVRNGQGVMSLSGHTDNVRAAQLDGEGRLLLTGSADHTLRLWDLGQQRCVQTLAVHTDSVWCLAASPGFATVYSGGRDGRIYRTRLATRVSELLAAEEQPVAALAVAGDQRRVWAATTGPSVHLWEVDAPEPAAIGGCGLLPTSPRSPLGAAAAAAAAEPCCLLVGASAAARARQTFEGHGSHPAPRRASPAAATPGVPPIQRAVALTDRRHVLTQDAEGAVACWDLACGRVVRDWGRTELRAVEAALFQPCHCVSAWCVPEVKLGCLGGTMEPPQCFGAEVYAQDLGDEEAPVDLKVNFGEQMLVALFAGWAQRQQQQQQQQTAHRGEQASDGDAPMADGQDGDAPMADGQDGAADGLAAPSSRFRFRSNPSPVVMVSGGGDGVPWRCAVDAFTGREDVPQWVADCVLHGRHVSRDLKLAFQLAPLPGSQLPSLLQSKLNAPRVLRVNKVADYVRRKMGEQGIALREEPLLWDAARAERWAGEVGADGGDGIGSDSGAAVHALRPVPPSSGDDGTAGAVLITCAGHAVPWDFSLAAVRQWIWRRSDDLLLQYSVRDPGAPLRLPAIRPPA